LTPYSFLAAVRLRTYALLIGSDGSLDYDGAERIATRQIAAQARRERATTLQRPVAPPTGEVTVHNVRAVFAARVEAISKRLRNPLARPPADSTPRESSDAPSVAPRVAPRASRPKVTINKRPQPEPPANQIVGVFVGTVGTAELISDEEFHPVLHDRTTQNWRQSIEANERRARVRVG
jgi:hypothetical protein